MTIEGGLLYRTLPAESMDIIYKIGDSFNKIGFGLVIYSLAINSKKEEATA